MKILGCSNKVSCKNKIIMIDSCCSGNKDISLNSKINEEIADIAKDINQEAIYYQIFDNKISEDGFYGYPNNIIFAYYGYDEEDIVNSNYAFKSIWADKYQDKDLWYKGYNKSIIINNICVEENTHYSSMKEFIINNKSNENKLLIESTSACVYKMIIITEKYLKNYREYINHTITENELISKNKALSIEIRKLYIKQSDLPIPSKELHDWSNAYSNLASEIDNLVISYYQSQNRDSKNRIQLMDIAIKTYNKDLEKVKKWILSYSTELALSDYYDEL